MKVANLFRICARSAMLLTPASLSASTFPTVIAGLTATRLLDPSLDVLGWDIRGTAGLNPGVAILTDNLASSTVGNTELVGVNPWFDATGALVDFRVPTVQITLGHAISVLTLDSTIAGPLSPAIEVLLGQLQFSFFLNRRLAFSGYGQFPATPEPWLTILWALRMLMLGLAAFPKREKRSAVEGFRRQLVRPSSSS